MSGFVSTWADGFGTWHAVVRAQDLRHYQAREIARHAIIAELMVREGPNFDPASVKLAAEIVPQDNESDIAYGFVES